MKRALRARHSLVVVTSAEDALAQLVNGADFDAVVCDLMMPGMPGWVFAERLTDVRPDLAPYTRFVSGGAFTDAARQFVDRASDQFLAKPYSADELADALERLPGSARPPLAARGRSPAADAPPPLSAAWWEHPWMIRN
jgi:CheY-like chemotaxis protein